MNDLYEREMMTLSKDTIYAAKAALRAGLENTQELLIEHDAALGRTTRKNRFIADNYETDIHNMQLAIQSLEAAQWQKEAYGPLATPVIDNLACLVRRLAYAWRKEHGESSLTERALQYLEAQGLGPTVLRSKK